MGPPAGFNLSKLYLVGTSGENPAGSSSYTAVHRYVVLDCFVCEILAFLLWIDKSPHSQQFVIFAVHKFIEIDGMSHRVLGIHGTIEFQHIWWKFLYFSLSVELFKGWFQWLPKHFFFWLVFSFIFVSFKQDRTMSSIVKLEKINTKFVEDVQI